MAKIKGKNIVITGGASGIGRLMALLCAEKGANVALLDINKNSLEQTVKEVRAKGDVDAQPYVCDISDEGQVKDTAKKIKSHFKKVDILINNAGIVAGKLFSDMTLKDFQKTMSVNFLGLVTMTQQFSLKWWKEMRDRSSISRLQPVFLVCPGCLNTAQLNLLILVFPIR